ncbi:MAG TPA: proline--tRNA ligase [Egibacteraceae bacterium]|nr:proline--tRNA ligase [Egibacteraceae bacterium]
MSNSAAPAAKSQRTPRKDILTPQSEDFPRWYQDVVAKAEMAENGPVRGTMIIKPWGYAIWEHIQAEMDARIKATGHENVYFPMLIPHSFLQREAQHVEGFSPELAIVTHGGGEELAEPLVVRPTSETTIGDAMSRWVQGYRDLPLLLNQWANIVRWELRPRLFLRTTEFLWQEGHTAHATWDEAQAETLKILTEVYDDVIRGVLAIPSMLGRKTVRERFAGAVVTYTLEALMRDGKALQMGTSHNLGQNFANAFGIEFTDAGGERQHAFTTSWGVSTRVVGGLIMSHGDDAGLRLPPLVAPVQAVVLAVKEEAIDACSQIAERLRAAGVRARVDDRTAQSFGRRAVEWELKGVPVRLEIGPRDLAEGKATLVRRDQDGKDTLSLDSVVQAIPRLLDEIQSGLLAQALRLREDATQDVEGLEEIDGSGFFRIPWERVGDEGEAQLNASGYSVRCLVTADGGIPEAEQEDDLIAYVAKAY